MDQPPGRPAWVFRRLFSGRFPRKAQGHCRVADKRIVRHPGRHGIKAQPEENPRGGISISDVLLSRATDLGADMIVAGAITTHSCARACWAGSAATCSIT